MFHGGCFHHVLVGARSGFGEHGHHRGPDAFTFDARVEGGHHVDGDEGVTQVGGEPVQTNRHLHREGFLCHAPGEEPSDGQPCHR